MAAILQAERATRDQRTRLGYMTFDMAKAAEMCDVGQGLVISGCPLDRLPRHLIGAVLNAHPYQCVITCHSYEYAEELADACRDRGVKAILLDRDELPTAKHAKASVIVTVPERLYHLRGQVREGSLCPRLLILVDPNGITIRTTRWQERDVCRAQGVCDFRAACLGAGHQVVPIFWTTSPAHAFCSETVRKCLGVEALLYLDGQTLRTASLSEAATTAAAALSLQDGDPVATTAYAWLDEAVTAARENHSLLLTVAGGAYGANDQSLREFAAERSYPLLDAGDAAADPLSLFAAAAAGVNRVQDLRDRLDRQLRLINKRIVVAAGVDRLYSRLGEELGSFLLAGNPVNTLLLAAAPDGWGVPDLDAVFEAHGGVDKTMRRPHVVMRSPA